MKIISLLFPAMIISTLSVAQTLSGKWGGAPVNQQVNNNKLKGFNDSYIAVSLLELGDSCTGITEKKLHSGIIIRSAFAGDLDSNKKHLVGKELYEIESPDSRKYYYLACSYDLNYSVRKGVEYLEGTMSIEEMANNYPSISHDRNGQIAIPETRPVTYTLKLKRTE
ncbi:MAG: hypothetical protein NTW29_01115 [Bacteroidetes bacterium]|nr:hypothetical protein [Bacteroidota bacterium]